MTESDVHAPQLRTQVLAPEGSGLVLAEWTAEAAVGEEPQFQAPLHQHEEDEAWYVLEGALRVRVGDREVEASMTVLFEQHGGRLLDE